MNIFIEWSMVANFQDGNQTVNFKAKDYKNII